MLDMTRLTDADIYKNWNKDDIFLNRRSTMTDEQYFRSIGLIFNDENDLLSVPSIYYLGCEICYCKLWFDEEYYICNKCDKDMERSHESILL